MCIFLMVRGYYIYKDIWQWQKATWLMWSDATLSIATCCSSVNLQYCPVGFHVRVHFVYFNASHFSQPHYCDRAKGCRQESARVWKVIWRLEGAGRMPSLHHYFHVLGSPVWHCWNFELQIFAFFILYFEASYEMFKNLYHLRISHYTVTVCSGNGLHQLPTVMTRGGWHAHMTCVVHKSNSLRSISEVWCN